MEKSASSQIPSVTILPIPGFCDNYFWLINDAQQRCAIVDPGDAEPILQTLQERNLHLEAILVTHHHHDHIGGIVSLLKHFSVPVYGPASKKIPQITRPVRASDEIKLFDNNIAFKVMEIPGHTQDHIAYFGYPNQSPVLFCGDTVFAAGCGRVFDGSCQQLRKSIECLNELPQETQLYCAHEYTLANLEFAQAVEPNNSAIKARILSERNKRSSNLPTVPTTLTLERETNPFFRYQEPDVQSAIQSYWKTNYSTADDVFCALRRWKDEF